MVVHQLHCKVQTNLKSMLTPGVWWLKNCIAKTNKSKIFEYINHKKHIVYQMFLKSLSGYDVVKWIPMNLKHQNTKFLKRYDLTLVGEIIKGIKNCKYTLLGILYKLPCEKTETKL